MVALGRECLLEAFRLHSMVRNDVMETIFDRIVTGSDAVLHWVSFLQELVLTQPMMLLEHTQHKLRCRARAHHELNFFECAQHLGNPLIARFAQPRARRCSYGDQCIPQADRGGRSVTGTTPTLTTCCVCCSQLPEVTHQNSHISRWQVKS